MRIPSGVTDQVIYFVAVDATDLKTRETGLTSFTVYRSRNGGSATAMTTPTVTEVDATNMPGVYKLLLDEDMTIDAGDDSQEMCFHITQASMAPVTRTIELYRPKITAGNTLTVASDGDLSEVNTLTGHTAQTGDAFARLGAPAGASVSADILTVDNLVDDLESRLGTPSNLGSGATVAANLADIEAQTDDIGVAGAGLTSIPWNAAWDAEVQSEVNDALTAAQTESYAADGATASVVQILYLLQALLSEFAVSGTTVTAKKLDGSTTAATFTLDDGTNPTSITRAT